jgi:SNF2 family DNA or RNA helicase
MKLLKKFKNEGKKVLVFSQFVIMLDLLKDFLDSEGFNV